MFMAMGNWVFFFSALIFSAGVASAAPSSKVKTLEEARKLYGKGQYVAAARAYERITDNKPEFLRSREELAWSYLRAEEWSRLRGLLPHLNSRLVPLRWRLEGRVLSSMLYLRDCQYEQVRAEIEKFRTELEPFNKVLQAKIRSGRNPGYWQALQTEVKEAVFKMQFVHVELRSRLVLISRQQGFAPSEKSSTPSPRENLVAGAQVFPVDDEFWSDELFKARGDAKSSCAKVHSVKEVSRVGGLKK